MTWKFGPNVSADGPTHPAASTGAASQALNRERANQRAAALGTPGLPRGMRVFTPPLDSTRGRGPLHRLVIWLGTRSRERRPW